MLSQIDGINSLGVSWKPESFAGLEVNLGQSDKTVQCVPERCCVIVEIQRFRLYLPISGERKYFPKLER